MQTNQEGEREFEIVHRVLAILSELPPTRRAELVWELAIALGKPSWAKEPADVWPANADPSDDEGSCFDLSDGHHAWIETKVGRRPSILRSLVPSTGDGSTGADCRPGGSAGCEQQVQARRSMGSIAFVDVHWRGIGGRRATKWSAEHSWLASPTSGRNHGSIPTSGVVHPY